MSPLIARGTASFDPIPAGVHIAICTGVYDLGTHHDQKFNKDTRRLQLVWEVPEVRGRFERDGLPGDLPQQISQQYSLTLNRKANLYKDLSSWRGRAFTEEELAGFDLMAVLGKCCQIQVIHHEVEGRTYANVGTVMSLPKGVTPSAPENPLLRFSFDDEAPRIPDQTPGWIRNKIEESKEWRVLTNTSDEPARLAEPSGDSAREEDDDVPF